MRKALSVLVISVLVATLVALAASAAVAGNPHFVGTPTITRTDNSLTISGKEAGLGNEEQVHIVVTATAECVNPGGHHPLAANKTDVSAEGDFPVQNGKANFTLTVTASFKPPCSPPMTVRFTNVTVTDTTNGISKSFPGTF